MRTHSTIVLALSLSALTAVTAQQPAGGSPFVRTYLEQARAQQQEGKVDDAIASVRRVLERDDKHLGALRLYAELSEAKPDIDVAVHTWHRWLDVYDQRTKRPTRTKERREVAAHLLELDTEAKAWEKIQRSYVAGLTSLGRDYQKRKDWLGALDAYQHLLQVEPEHRTAKLAIKEIRRTGGKEVAIDDVFAGAGDPLGGMSTDEVLAEDQKHAEWPDAYTKDTDNYRYRTNAGRMVLETSAIAMEQMNRFYRRFFRFKEDGGNTPKIEIRIFRSRDEYLELGRSPAEWSGGQFTGDAVETFTGGTTGKESIRSMYGTLFHEAAHQFVRLTGPFVPGWLNEAYASFFEGCTILSNGTVRWNQVPPGRLFPLASRMEKGWMASTDEAAPGSGGRSGREWSTPEGAPPFRMVVEGAYTWGPPWYAPTWGVVYFLYNYRTDDGRTVYRDALHEYYTAFKRGRPADPIANFEEIVLQGAKLSPVRSIDELDPIWKEWILALRDRETGQSDAGQELVKFAKAALERDEKQNALELFEEAREHVGDHPDVLWQIATLLEDLKQKPRAAATYREFRRELELRGMHEDERHQKATRKIKQLDPLWGRYQLLKQKLAKDGLALAHTYEQRSLQRMALEIARRMSASFSIPEVLEYYVALAKQLGGLSLAQWRVAYNEHDLTGWSSDRADVYRAYGAEIRAEVPNESAPGGLLTSQLTCDVTFDADYSLEAEMRVPLDPDGGAAGTLVGLCFGLKSDSDFHAVILHPKGFLDLATNRGNVWTIHDHRSVPFAPDEWHRLRIDVTGKSVDIYVDGLYVRSFEFGGTAAVRGAFGLISGVGEAAYKNLRLLARDPHDPAARIERELAMERVMQDAALRQPGTFTGFEPPELSVGWRQGEATTLTELRGKPVMLVFWSPAQERAIPTAAYIRHLIERGQKADLETLVVCDSGTDAATLDAYLRDHPLPGARIAIDAARALTYDAYFIKPGHFGMPRFLLIKPNGRVVFEGDPGLKAGIGWREKDGATYVDAAFDKLVSS